MPKIVLPQEIQEAFVRQLTDHFGGHSYYSEYVYKDKALKHDIIKLRKLHRYHGYDPKYQKGIPKSLISQTMKKYGWKYLDHSVRAAYTRNGYVAKVAFDSAGISQNYLEVKFYKEKLKKVQEDKDKPNYLFFPKLYEWHPSYLWLTTKKIEGKKPRRSDYCQQIRAIDLFLEKYNLLDVHSDNIIKEKDKSLKLYLIDCGFYDMYRNVNIL